LYKVKFYEGKKEVNSMNKRIKNTFLILCLVALLFSPSALCIADTELSDGTVQGLPEKLTVIDEDGQSASSSTGEYFFEVEDMISGETYTKHIQIMNLREDKAYHVYFYAEPLDESGEIDLKNECTAEISLGDEKLYEGVVTGEGDMDITTEPLDLGVYKPGQQGLLNCSITWTPGAEGGYIDNGRRLVDVNGTTILREGSGKTHISGEITFKWVFYAVVDDSYTPPKTGLTAIDTRTEILILVILGIMICGMIALIIVKKNKKQQESKYK
jgi:hypothetical protein